MTYKFPLEGQEQTKSTLFLSKASNMLQVKCVLHKLLQYLISLVHAPTKKPAVFGMPFSVFPGF